MAVRHAICAREMQFVRSIRCAYQNRLLRVALFWDYRPQEQNNSTQRRRRPRSLGNHCPIDAPVLDGAARRLAAVRPLHEPRDELGAEQHEHLVRAARAVRATPAPGEERGPQLHPRGPGGRAVRATPAPDDDRQAAAAAGRARPRRRLGRGAVEPAEVRARRRARPDDRVPRLAG